MATYWQAEVYEWDGLLDIDFPHRATAEEALRDAQDGIDRLRNDSRYSGLSAAAAEWREDANGTALNTGAVRPLQEQS